METETIYVSTRTGRKLHKASPGSSVTRCGHWLRVDASTMRVEITEAELAKADLVKCEHCFAPHEFLQASTATDPREMTFRELLDTGATEGTDLRSTDARHHAKYLLRTMTTAERFAYLSVAMQPRMQKLYDEIMKESRS